MLVQRTLTNSINAVGVGLHSGRKISIKLLPAEEDTGIIFRRVDIDPPVEIKAIVNNVGATTLATTLIQGEVQISTIEHMLSAFAGLGLIMQLSKLMTLKFQLWMAVLFVFLIQSAGIKEQTKPKKFIKIKKEISVETTTGLL